MSSDTQMPSEDCEDFYNKDNGRKIGKQKFPEGVEIKSCEESKMAKNEKSKEVAKRVFKKLEEKLPGIVEEAIEEMLDEYDLEKTSKKVEKIDGRVKKIEEKIDSLEKKIDNGFEDNKRAIDNRFGKLEELREKDNEKMFKWINDILEMARGIKSLNEKIDNELQELKQKNSTLEKEIQELKEEKTKSDLKLKELDENKANLKECKEQNRESEEHLKQMKEWFEKAKREKDEIQKELEPLREFKDTVANKKVTTLLEKVLSNPALESFKREFDITDRSAKSIANLLRRLADEKVFVNSFYKKVEEYKKQNQEGLLDSEIEFYKEVNSFFGKNIFSTPLNKRVSESKFDKKLHRGINGETGGTLSDDKALLIPACAVEERKAKVKLK